MDKYQIINKNKKQFFLAGEVHNSSASSIEYMEKMVWRRIDQLAINTLLIPIYWELFEPQQGVFDYSLLENHLKNAADKKVQVIFLWYGLWKNGLSTYVPQWMKVDDTGRFIRVQDKNGHHLESFTPLCKNSTEADIVAFGKLCSYLADHPLKDHVAMIQVENELGCLQTDRDYSDCAQNQYQGKLPTVIQNVYPEALFWHDIPHSQECFMAYYYAKTIESLAKLVEKHLDIPVFTNVWLKKVGKMPGEYPSGGAIDTTWKVWKAVAKSLTFIAPDIYEEDISAILSAYSDDQSLFIPETRIDKKYISNIFYAFGKGAIGYSPFGIEDLLADQKDQNYTFLKQLGLEKEAFNCEDTKAYLNRGYEIISELTPLLLHPKAAVFSFRKENCNQLIFEDTDYRWEIKLFSTKDMIHSAGMIIKLEDTYYCTGANIAFNLNLLQHSQQRVGILSLEEGYFDSGVWQKTRQLNGDEAYYPFIGEAFKIVKMKLFKY
ncbi:DUF5597 domain-containing protein [Enterococcus sp. DIV0876]|uniref:DUF5597 domain-containing protein n=1 Tax=Enterococcus sp. DIV0876 TaxID=2774633 RepID=UPI003D2FA42B